MKRIYLVGLITSALLLTAAGSLWAQDSPITVSFSDPSRPGTLRVGMMSGNLTIKAYSGKDVTIQTQTKTSTGGRSRQTREAESQGLRRLEAITSGLTIEEENNVMVISTSRMNSATIEIQVPTKTNLKLSITNGDNLAVQGVDGEIEATNTNGNISLTDVSGSVIAHSTNGKVVATLKRVTPQKPMAFTSLNDNIDVTLPADTKANLKLKAENGDVWTDFDIQIKPNAAPAIQDTRSKGGRIRIQVDKSVLGTINGGGPDFELRTFNGNVYIRKAK